MTIFELAALTIELAVTAALLALGVYALGVCLFGALLRK